MYSVHRSIKGIRNEKILSIESNTIHKSLKCNVLTKILDDWSNEHEIFELFCYSKSCFITCCMGRPVVIITDILSTILNTQLD